VSQLYLRHTSKSDMYRDLGKALRERNELRARVEALEAGLREIEDWAPNWAQGVDENVDAIRDHARALLEQKP